MSAAAARALAAALDALPSLTALRFQDARDPELAALERDMDGEGEDLDGPALSYLFGGTSDDTFAAYNALQVALTRHNIVELVMDAPSSRVRYY